MAQRTDYVLIVSPSKELTSVQRTFFKTVLDASQIISAESTQMAIDLVRTNDGPHVHWFVNSGNRNGKGVALAESLRPILKDRLFFVLWTSEPPPPDLPTQVDACTGKPGIEKVIAFLRQWLDAAKP